MESEPRARAAAESYPTFWNTTAPAPAPRPVRAEEAYTTFVSLTEGGFPDADDSPADDDPGAE